MNETDSQGFAAANRPPVVHKRSAGIPILCGRPLAAGEMSSDYWDGVTCQPCLDLKPVDAGGRTSFKHTHRVEGLNFVD